MFCRVFQIFNQGRKWFYKKFFCINSFIVQDIETGSVIGIFFPDNLTTKLSNFKSPNITRLNQFAFLDVIRRRIILANATGTLITSLRLTLNNLIDLSKAF